MVLIAISLHDNHNDNADNENIHESKNRLQIISMAMKTLLGTIVIIMAAHPVPSLVLCAWLSACYSRSS